MTNIRETCSIKHYFNTTIILVKDSKKQKLKKIKPFDHRHQTLLDGLRFKSYY